MKINILTLFPTMFAPLYESMIGRAIDNGILEINLIDIREYTNDKHRRVDDTPFGGGAGMIMQYQPIMSAVRENGASGHYIYMSPRGKVLDGGKTMELSRKEEITLLCGHYEGVDQRVIDALDAEEISIGDYVLTGGELPAMVLIDCVSRFIDGVLSSDESAVDESVYSGLLEYPQYTKPREVEGLEVPEILLSGNHKFVDLWRFEESLRVTAERRPDLLRRYIDADHEMSKAERKILDKYRE